MKCDELQRHSIRGVMYNGEEICGGFAYYDADEVDAAIEKLKAENRKLKRALYKACANWAHHRVFVRFKTNEKAWENVERKCLKKAKEYK